MRAALTSPNDRLRTVAYSFFEHNPEPALVPALLAALAPLLYLFTLGLLIVVLGGNGSITGSVIASIAVTVLMEALRFLDEPLNLLVVKTAGLPGLRMVVFSALLMAVVLFRQRGLMGDREFGWDSLSKAGLLPRRKGGSL